MTGAAATTAGMATRATLGVDPGVRVVAGPVPSSTVPMPVVPDGTPWNRTFGDRVGDTVHEHLTALGMLGAVGGIATGLLLPGNPLVRGAVGIAAALALPVLGALAGAALARRRPADQHASMAPIADAAGAPEALRVMSYNIREGIGPDGQFGGSDADMDALAATIRRDTPDVVVLQEVTSGSLQSQRRDVPAELARRLHPTSFVVGSSMTQLVGNQKGEAVMTFGGAHVEAARTLHHEVAGGSGLVRQAASFIGNALGDRAPDMDLFSDYNARSTVDTIVRTAGGRQLRVLTPHLGGGGLPSERPDGETAAFARQVVPLANAVRSGTDLGLPTIVAGDFNRDAASGIGAREVQVLGDAGVRDAFAAAGIDARSRARDSYPAETPGAAIDHIYVSKEIEVRAITVDKDGPAASDHRAVVADLQLG